jgi:hypothetical protein
MNSQSSPTESRLLAGFLLLAFGVMSLALSRLSPPTDWPIAMSGLASRVALVPLYCALTVILCSLIDRADGGAAVGSYRLLGRWFYWLGGCAVALTVALAVTRSNILADLLDPRRLIAVVAITAGGCAIFAYVSLRTGLPSPQREPVPVDAGRSGAWKNILALVLCLVAAVALGQRYREMTARDAAYEAQDESERRGAKPWNHDLNVFRGGMSVSELRAMLQRSGHNPRCFDDLRSENRIQPDDRSNCWTILRTAWGIPARMTAFAFGDTGLRNQLLRFPESSWPEVEHKLDQMGRRLPGSFGRDPDTHDQVFGWRMDSGLVQSAAPAPGGEITVLWTAKLDVARQYCRDRQAPLDVRELWPEIDCATAR